MADQGSEGLLSPYLRRKRFEAAAPYLKGRILDFGCGSGALAGLIHANQYLGVEMDSVSLQQASSRFSKHRFVSELPASSDRFDTIVSLAVIEHVSDPAEFLRTLAAHLDDAPTSRLVITTPHPSVDWVHDLGAAIGLLSKHANEEHEDLLDRTKLEMAGNQAGLKLVSYSRFLFGANQIAVYAKGLL
ncbi:MAG: class I SAM-dependent methyltransferase [Terriglobia bacterium]|jgi:SAM-dependent methyltransferase